MPLSHDDISGPPIVVGTRTGDILTGVVSYVRRQDVHLSEDVVGDSVRASAIRDNTT